MIYRIHSTGLIEMSAPKVSLSMLHSLSEPFDEMVKRLPDVGTRYIEIVDDGWHILDKQRVAALKEVGSSYSQSTLCMHHSQTSTLHHLQKSCAMPHLSA